MLQIFALPLPIRLLTVFIGGLALGSLVNWAIYRLAWNRRDISPWGPHPAGAPPRKATDRLPILGWLGLRREQSLHGRGFWIRPLMLELAMGAGLAWLYWWEVDQQWLVFQQLKNLLLLAGGIPGDVSLPVVSDGMTHAIFINHLVLITLMAAASFIDLDEKIIPDEITVPGTLLGLLVATLLPMGLLPHLGVPSEVPLIGEPAILPPLLADKNIFVEPTTLATPNHWPAELKGAPQWGSLLVGQACWWLWCFALTPRIWRGRHGASRALALITRRVIRELTRPPLAVIAWLGSLAVAAVWWWGGHAWMGLLTALVGLAVSGGMVWVVRLVGTAALRREAMGFGDVTLMMMIGTFLGWQAGVIIFFVAPFAGLVIGILQMLLHRDDVIPYGPFLCLGALAVAVRWPDFWTFNVQDVFQQARLIAFVLVACFALLGVMLAIWQMIKSWLFPPKK